MTWQFDPGPCPVDDAPHTTCTSPDYTAILSIPQLPMRDAMATSAAVDLASPVLAPAAPGESAPVSTKTYRRSPKP